MASPFALTLFLFLSLQAPGDRLFARAGATLRDGSSPAAHVLRTLQPGDEFAEGDNPSADEQADEELTGQRRHTTDLPVQTVDVPSQRVFSGFVAKSKVTADAPAPGARIATLHRATAEALTALESRQQPFADLRNQIYAWRKTATDDARQQAQVQLLADKLARFMETEITPHALDIEDWLSELRELQDPKTGSLTQRYRKVGAAFKP